MDKRLSADHLINIDHRVRATAADGLDKAPASDAGVSAAVLAAEGAAAVAVQAATAAPDADGGVMRCGCPGCMKAAAQAAHDGKSGDPQSVPPIGGDDIPDDTSSTVTLGVIEGESIHAALEHLGDKDFFQVSLSEGQTYEFTVVPDDADGTTGPDLMIEVYDSDGNLITQFDSGSNGDTEELDFTAPSDGVFYVNVAGYLDASTGGYTITGKLDDDAPQPNDGSPLAAIDWGGVRVDTDGVTTNSGDDVIHVYFAKTGEVVDHPIAPANVAEGWSDWEKAAAFSSFEQYENIINVQFNEVDSEARADFVFTTSSGPPVLLGAMSPPGESTEGVAWFNNKGIGWDEGGLQQGGYGYITFTHELGHGMGMANPHDNGGGSEVMHGVDDSGDSGDFQLNQGVFTVMTYNDGWPDGPDGTSPSNDYGWSGTLMAFDVALLQQKYGANMDYNTGNDTYTLWDENADGTMYACIWDAGGRDKIVAGDAMNVNIDLREATLKYEWGGGGYVSHAQDIIGGYTVANGVVIEDATGGAGIDGLTGNKADNTLDGLDGDDAAGGRGGADALYGRGGDDVLWGGRGADLLDGGAGRDFLRGGTDGDAFIFRPDALDGSIDRIFDLEAGDTVNLTLIDADTTHGGNQAFTLVAAFSGTAGEAALTYEADRDRTFLWLDQDGDGRADHKLVMDGDQTAFGGFVL